MRNFFQCSIFFLVLRELTKKGKISSLTPLFLPGIPTGLSPSQATSGKDWRLWAISISSPIPDATLSELNFCLAYPIEMFFSMWPHDFNYDFFFLSLAQTSPLCSRPKYPTTYLAFSLDNSKESPVQNVQYQTCDHNIVAIQWVSFQKWCHHLFRCTYQKF